MRQEFLTGATGPLLLSVIGLLAFLHYFPHNENLAFGHSSTPNIQEDSLVVTAGSSTVDRSGNVTATATVFAHRTGPATDTNWSIQLAVPSGYTISNGANPQTKSTSAHGSATASWNITAPSVPSGPDTFTVTASAADALLGPALSGSPETDSFMITTLNRNPTANDDSVTASEDTPPVPVSVLSNDTDADNDALLILSASQPANGSASITDANTTVTYFPDADFFGTDSIVYAVEDGFGGSVTGTITIVVTAVNDPPVQVDDQYSTNEDTTLNEAAPGVLANDTDVDNGSLSAILVDDVDDGNLTLNANGSFAYLPDPDFNGTDSFSYRANDGSLESNLAAVNIIVSPINDPPTATGDSYSVDKDSALSVSSPGILTNDTDVENDNLSSFLVESVSHGTLNLYSSGAFAYSPNPGYLGSDSFTYKASDGTDNSTVAVVSITVSPPSQEDTDEKDQESVRDRSNNRDETEQELGARRLTYDDSYFDANPLKRIQFASHSIVNSEGALFSSVPAGEQVTLSYSFRNYQKHAQQYSFILQIRDETGITLSIQSVKGILEKGEQVEIDKSWTAEKPGEYIARVFVWDDLDNPTTTLADLNIAGFRVR